MYSSTGADLAAGLRQPTEVLRRGGHRPLDVVASALDQLFLGLGRVAGIGVERGAVGRGVVAEPGCLRDLAPLRLDGLHLGQADLVDVAGVHLQRGPAADRGAVDLLAIGRRPDARLLAAGVPVLATERLEEGRVRGVDDIADDVADPLAVGVRWRPARSRG